MTAAERTALRKKYPAEKLNKIRKLYDKDVEVWGPIRAQRDEDIQCISTERGPWPQEEWDARTKGMHKRPALHEDVLTPYCNQVINKIEQNPMGVEANPSGDDADEESAEFVENRIRGWEYEENAQYAYQTAAKCAVEGSFGWWKLETRYGGGAKSKLGAAATGNFNTKVCCVPITDPSTITPGFWKKPDASDMRRAWEHEWMSIEEFKDRWPNARLKSFEAISSVAPTWTRDDTSIQVCAWWHLESDERELLAIDDPNSDTPVYAYDDEFTDEERKTLKVIRRRKEKINKVVKTIMSGAEVLDETDWIDPGEGEDVAPEIPLFGVFGRVKYEHGKMVIESLVRKGRVGQLLYDFTISAIQETIGLTPRVFFSGPEGTFDTSSNWSPRALSAYKEWKSVVDPATGQPLPPPKMELYEPPIAALEMAKDSILRGIERSIGMNSVEHKDKTAKSGKALDALTQEMTVGTSHYFGATRIAQERCYRTLMRILPEIERGTDQNVATRDKFGKQTVGPLPPKAYQGRYSVAVGTGKMYQTLQDKQAEFAQELMKVGGDPDILLVSLIGAAKMAGLGEYGDQIVEVFTALLGAKYPDVAKLLSGEEGAMMPPEALQAIQQAQQQLTALNEHAKQLETQVIELEDDIKAKKIESESKERVSAADNETKLQIEQMKAELAIRLKEIDIELKKIELEREKIRGSIAASLKGAELDSKETMQNRQQSHESVEAEASRSAASMEAEANRAHEAQTKDSAE